MIMNEQIKAVFFDVDGTLLSHTLSDVPKSTRNALKKLRRRGVVTVIATARHMIDLDKMPVKDMKFDGYITLNGQLTFDSNKKVYSCIPIDKGEMEILAHIFKARKIPFALVSETGDYINYVNDTVVSAQAQFNSDIPSIGEYKGEEIYQIMAFVSDHEKQLLDDLLDECSITTWSDTGIDIIPREGGKTAGIRKFLEDNGLDPSQIMAFGDGENDIEMLQFAGIGVAMGNGGEKVKAAADYVTDTVDNGGIEKALRHFDLID